jgi:hypothetical protein
MKLTKILEQVMSEVGDTANIKPYTTSWETTGYTNNARTRTYIVRFSTGGEKDDTKYRVYNILNKRERQGKEAWYMTVEFGTEGDISYDYSSVVNNDKMYRVMATIIQIVRDIMDEFNKEGEYIREIWIDPSKNYEDDTRRTKLYRAYIEKNMPQGSDLEVPDDMSYIKLTLPKQN